MRCQVWIDPYGDGGYVWADDGRNFRVTAEELSRFRAGEAVRLESGITLRQPQQAEEAGDDLRGD